MIQRFERIIQPALVLAGLCFLEPSTIRLRIKAQRDTGILECSFVITFAIVVSAQVNVCRDELSLPRIVENDGFLITRDGSGVITQSLLSKTQSIRTFHVRRVD